MIHSAAVVLDGAAALFLAPDEGGKTTIVRHALPGMTLCDDQNILRHEGAAILVHSTPLGLYTHGPRSAPLGGMFLVEQAESFELLPLNSLDAFEYLWNEHQGYRVYLPRALRLKTFDFLYDVCRRAPAYRMRFPKDTIDWDAIDAAMVG